jgi:peptidoglycan L-alanyl-D-glutamate endopeptidase CwlK
MYDALRLINLSDRIRWGGVWDRTLDELDRFALEDEVQAYVARRRSQGKRAFPDGPHFQIEVHV